jgi:putative chitinase
MDIVKLKLTLPEKVYNELPSVMSAFKIDTPIRLANFLGQCHHESGGFKVVEENLKYSAKRLLEVFPKYFTSDSAKKVGFNPQMIANIVYSNRMGNGNEASGDGYKFRGRGYIQLTGRLNYEKLQTVINGHNIVLFPDIVASAYPLYSAGWFWSTNGLNKIADTGDIVRLTKRINGGTNGLEDRRLMTDKYAILLK